jgi:hypothetical protein
MVYPWCPHPPFNSFVAPLDAAASGVGVGRPPSQACNDTGDRIKRQHIGMCGHYSESPVRCRSSFLRLRVMQL